MNVAELLHLTSTVTSPPPGAINVRIGKTVVGPGGKWVPCATQIPGGVYCSSVFEVGPGRRQVCAANTPTTCADEALSKAIAMACSAAA